MSVAPRIAVTTDPWLVDGDSLVKPRRRFAGRKLYPDGLEAKGARGEAARGGPAPMRSGLSCRCMKKDDGSVRRTHTHTFAPGFFSSYFFPKKDGGRRSEDFARNSREE